MQKPRARVSIGAESNPRVVQSVARAALLLKTLATSGKPMGLGDLAHSISISKPATFHLLRTLELEGFVTRGTNATYCLGWGLYELGSAVIRSVDLARVARVYLDELADDTGEAVLLGILDGNSVLYLDKGQATESFSMIANVGRRSPLHTNASGKVLLAYQDDAFIKEVLAEPLVANTPSTVCDPAVLDLQLALVRRNGYATCWQEQELGLSSVAVPVFDYTGKVCASVALAGPAERVRKGAAAVIAQKLKVGAEKISAKLGGTLSSMPAR